MERMANLPVPPPDTKKVSAQITNIDTISSSSSSSSSFSSSSSLPDFVREVQAAFKRQRALGTMQSSSIGPRRMMVPRRGVSKSSASNVGFKVDTKKPHDDVSRDKDDAQKGLILQTQDTGETQEDVSVTLPCILSTITKTSDQDLNPFDVRTMQPKPSATGCNSNNAAVSLQLEPQHLDCQRMSDVSTGTPAGSQGANDRKAIELKNVSSHMSSLALTEMEWDANQADASTLINDGMKHNNIQNTESDSTSRSEGGISTLLGKGNVVVQDQLNQFTNFLSRPATQFSGVGQLCATTTSVHPTSAPILNSMTSSSQLSRDSRYHAGGQAVGDFMSDSQPASQGNMGQPSHKDGSAAKASSSAIDTHVEVKEHYSSMEKESCVSKESEIPNKNPADVHDLADVQLRASSSNVKLEPLKEKQQKVSSSKGASAPRKKTYDPDLFFKVNGKLYQRLGKIGSGGSSEVHKVISSNCTIYALKKIKLKGRDYATAYGFCQEIEYLNKLKGKNNIIQLIDYEVTDKALLREVMSGSMTSKDIRVKDDGYIYMVLEYGEIDLAHMLSQKWREMDGSNNQTIDDSWLRFYWQQILEAVNTIHEERIVHSDLKPANFLLVKGFLKLIDFGIAKAIMSDTTNIQRDSQVGTLSYMSPEAFMCNENDANGNTIRCGRPSDIWSLGCILYQMVYGRTPFADHKTFWAKFKVITDPNHEITYGPVSNPWLLDLMKKCLAWDRNKRWRIPELLTHPYLVPPLPHSQSASSLYNGYKLLQIIAESSNDNQEVVMLCYQLKQILTNPVMPRVGSNLCLSRDEQCELLSHMSSLSSQLQDCLTKNR